PSDDASTAKYRHCCTWGILMPRILRCRESSIDMPFGRYGKYKESTWQVSPTMSPRRGAPGIAHTALFGSHCAADLEIDRRRGGALSQPRRDSARPRSSCGEHHMGRR